MTLRNIKTAAVLIIAVFLFIKCTPEKEDYTEDWVGFWQTTDELSPVNTKYLHEGTIIKDEGERNKVIMAGSLLNFNSSYKIPIKLTSSVRGSIDYENGFTLKGNAVMGINDTIRLYLELTEDNKSVKDTLTLVKSNQSENK